MVSIRRLGGDTGIGSEWTLGAWNLTLIPGLSPPPAGLFPVVFTGWVVGDIIVLAVIATALLTALTPVIKRSPIYVRRWRT